MTNITPQCFGDPLLLKQIMGSIQLPLYLKDTDCRFIGANQLLLDEVMGMTLDDVLGKTIQDLPNIHKSIADLCHSKEQQLLRDAKPQVFEGPIISPGGVKQIYRVNKSVFRNNEGDIAGIVGTMFDITSLEEANQILYTEAEKYRQIFDTKDVAIYITTLSGDILSVNQAFMNIFGIPTTSVLYNVQSTEFYAEPHERDVLLDDLKDKGQSSKLIHLKDSNGQPFSGWCCANLAGDLITGYITKVDEEQYLIRACSYCDKMELDGQWVKPIKFMSKQKHVLQDPSIDYQFTHGVCPTCYQKVIEELKFVRSDRNLR